MTRGLTDDAGPDQRPEKPQRRLRILMLTSTLPRRPGDTGPRFVLDLARNLKDRHDVLLLAPHAPGAALREQLDGVPVERFRYFFEWGEQLCYDEGMGPKLRRKPWLWLVVPIFMVAQVVAILRHVRRRDADCVHAHWLIPQGICAIVAMAMAMAGRRIPLVCTAHGADLMSFRGHTATALKRLVVRRSSLLGAVSPAISEGLLRLGAPASKIRDLAMGVELNGKPTIAPQRDLLHIAFAGRIVEKKGLPVLLHAFALLLKRVPDVELSIVGDGPDLPSSRLLAQSLGVSGKVRFLGSLENSQVLALLRTATVAALPSIVAQDGDAEGLPVVLLEAIASSCPVVATDSMAFRTVISHGRSGLLFPEGASDKLAEALQSVLADPGGARAMARNALEYIRPRYSWQACAERHADAYDAIV